MSNFVHLQVKSHFSISSGLPNPKSIIETAKHNGMHAVALTDKNGFFGLVKFYRHAINSGIKPICGVDLDLKGSDGEKSNILLYAKNKKGLEILFALSTESFLMSEKGEKYILESTITSNPNDIVCILPADSEDFQKNIINKPVYVEEKMDRFSSVFNGNLFVGANCYQKDYLNTTGFIAELADKKSIPLVALNDVLFINKDDHLAHQAKVAINN